MPRRIDVPKWFFDEDLRYVGAGLAEIVTNVVHPGHPALPEVPPKSPDTVWIPVVAAMDLIVVSRDAYSHVGEYHVLQAAGLRRFRIVAKKRLLMVDILGMMCHRLPAMEVRATQLGPGPWLVKMDASGAFTSPAVEFGPATQDDEEV